MQPGALTIALDNQPIRDIDFAADLEEVQRNQPEMSTTVWPGQLTLTSSTRSSGNSSPSIYWNVPFPMSGSRWR